MLHVFLLEGKSFHHLTLCCPKGGKAVTVFEIQGWAGHLMRGRGLVSTRLRGVGPLQMQKYCYDYRCTESENFLAFSKIMFSNNFFGKNGKFHILVWKIFGSGRRTPSPPVQTTPGGGLCSVVSVPQLIEGSKPAF